MGQEKRKALAAQLKTRYLAASGALEPSWRSSQTEKGLADLAFESRLLADELANCGPVRGG